MTITRRLFMKTGGSLLAGAAAVGPSSADEPESSSTQVTRLDGLVFDGGGGVFNVKSSAFGAAGDGERPDEDSLQGAIDAAPAGAAILLPPGAYKLTRGITLREGRTLFAFGATIKGPRGSRCITLESKTRLEGITFSDEDERSGSNYFVYAEGERDVDILDCRFEAIENYCVQLDGCETVRIIGCHFHNVSQAPGSRAIGVSDDGISDSRNVLIDQCSFVNDDADNEGAAGIIVSTPEHSPLRVIGLVVRNCYFERMGRSGTGPRGDIDIYRNVKDLLVENCVSDHSVMDLVKGNNGENVIVRDNIIRDSGSHGIIWQRRANDIGTPDDIQPNLNLRVLNNLVVNAGRRNPMGGRGIDIRGSEGDPARDVLIANNRIERSALEAVRTKDCVGVQVTGNCVNHSGETAIVCENGATSSELRPLLISQNRIDMGGRDKSAIHVTTRDGGGCMISSNTVARVGGGAHGIRVDAALRSQVRDNQFVSVSGRAVEFGPTSDFGAVNNRGTIASGEPNPADWQDGNLVVNTDNERVWLIFGNDALRLK